MDERAHLTRVDPLYGVTAYRLYLNGIIAETGVSKRMVARAKTRD